MIQLKVDKSKIEKVLKELSQKTSNLRPVMRAIAEDMMQATKENFDTQGARLGKKWQNLSPSTLKIRARRGYNGPMLQQEGHLYDSITSFADDNTAMVGSNLVYAKTHQLGSNKTVSISPFARKVASRNVFQRRKDGKGDTKKLLASGIGYVKQHSRKMNITARPFLGLNDNDINGIQNTIVKYLEIN
jgi:phage virion morphogenesis protein